MLEKLERKMVNQQIKVFVVSVGFRQISFYDFPFKLWMWSH